MPFASRYSPNDIRNTSNNSHTTNDEEETIVLRAIVKRQQELRRTNLSTIEIFRVIQSLGYKKVM